MLFTVEVGCGKELIEADIDHDAGGEGQARVYQSGGKEAEKYDIAYQRAERIASVLD